MRASRLLLLAIGLLAAPAMAQTVPPPYRVVAEERTETNRTVDIRIDRRLEEAELDAIANAVVNREQKPYARTIVNFLLPSTRTGDAPWATATLQREVRIKIPGLRLDEERLFIAEAHADTRIVVGHWLTSTPATPGRLTIHRDGRQLIAEWRLRSGVKSRDEVTETRVAAGRRFDLKSGSVDDHFIVTHAGDLEIRSSGKLIAVAEPIKPLAPGQAPQVAARRAPGNVVEPWPPAPAGSTQPTATALAADAEPAEVPAAASVKPAQKAAPRKAPTKPAAERIDLTKFLQPTS